MWGCSNNSVNDPSTTSAVPVTPTTVVSRQSDGVLRIGLLVPRSGPSVAIGDAVVAGVSAAVNVINSTGGVLGQPVEIIERDEGSDTATALVGVNTLLVDDQVDVIIGPTSSRVALAVLGRIVGQGTLACSPAASAISLSAFPDQGLFVRTVPSDSLQAEALARLVDQTGRNRVGVLFPDDLYGRDFADAVVKALTSLGMELTGSIAYATDSDDLSGPALAIVADSPSAVVVLGNADLGTRMLVAATDAAPSPSPWFIVNDAIRRPVQPALIAELSPERRSRIRGVSPAILTTNPDLLKLLGATERDPSTAFASMAVDCLNLIALGAVAQNSDNPRAIASQIPGMSRGGTSCRDFPTCAELLAEGRNVDYNGPEGLIRMDPQGDVTVGAFERFSFDNTGKDVTDLRFTVGSAS